jgi:soluble lytic murein transglycosylase-like protein
VDAQRQHEEQMMRIYQHGLAVWALVLFTLWLPSPAVAQDFPDMTQDGWVFDIPETAGMGPDPAPYDAVGQWTPTVEDACGYDASCVNWMTQVIACESGGDPNAVGANGETGLLQFKLWLWPGVSNDPYDQIYAAADAYLRGLGYNWVCAPW